MNALVFPVESRLNWPRRNDAAKMKAPLGPQLQNSEVGSAVGQGRSSHDARPLMRADR
jgi:hypothetical protein